MVLIVELQNVDKHRKFKFRHDHFEAHSACYQDFAEKFLYGVTFIFS